MNRIVFNFIAFEAGWMACVLGAAKGMPLLGLMATALIIAVHLKTTSNPVPELKLMAVAVAMGLFFDSLLVTAGWLVYPNGTFIAGIAPYWILAMWALFATTLNLSMVWLKKRLWLAAIMGAIFGPVSYVAGARLGGLEFINYQASIVALAVIWGISMPLLFLAARRYNGNFEKRQRPTFVPVGEEA